MRFLPPKAVRATTRNGTVLIIISGICALLAMLSLSFLVRMRSDAEEAIQYRRQIQARVMLTAAMLYIQEASRMGWASASPDPILSPPDRTQSQLAEGYGWVDVRDGRPGPRDKFGNLLYRDSGVITDPLNPRFGYGPKFPAIGGRAARFELYRWTVPPRAIKPIMYPNPVNAQPTVAQSRLLAQEVGFYNLDQQPVIRDASVATGVQRQQWLEGDQRPFAGGNGTDPTWFRIYRMTEDDCRTRHLNADGRGTSQLAWTPGVFLITCGCGSSLGFRDWPDVQAEGKEQLFGGDRTLFEELRLSDQYFWYLCEWRPTVGYDTIYHYIQDSYVRFLQGNPFGGDDEVNYHRGPNQMLGISRNQGGTFTYIERLRFPPDGVPW